MQTSARKYLKSLFFPNFSDWRISENLKIFYTPWKRQKPYQFVLEMQSILGCHDQSGHSHFLTIPIQFFFQ